MESSRARDLTTAQQLAALRLHGVICSRSADFVSDLRKRVEMMSEPGADTATAASDAAELAWGLAMMAQSSAYLAQSLQLLAERCARLPIVSQDSTYRRACDSIATALALLEYMREKCDAAYETEHVIGIPGLSEHLAGEIRSMLVHGRAITTEECTINRESQD